MSVETDQTRREGINTTNSHTLEVFEFPNLESSLFVTKQN